MFRKIRQESREKYEQQTKEAKTCIEIGDQFSSLSSQWDKCTVKSELLELAEKYYKKSLNMMLDRETLNQVKKKLFDIYDENLTMINVYKDPLAVSAHYCEKMKNFTEEFPLDDTDIEEQLHCVKNIEEAKDIAMRYHQHADYQYMQGYHYLNTKENGLAVQAFEKATLYTQQGKIAHQYYYKGIGVTGDLSRYDAYIEIIKSALQEVTQVPKPTMRIAF